MDAKWEPINHRTVTVLGSRWKANAPWGGLDFGRAVLRDQSTLMLAILGSGAHPDHHLDVPWCHPDDQPGGWADDCWYRVRPAVEPGRKWLGRIVHSVRFERKNGQWGLRIEFEQQRVTYPPELLPIPDEDDDAEVIVVDPDTGKQTVVWPNPPPQGDERRLTPTLSEKR